MKNLILLSLLATTASISAADQVAETDIKRSYNLGSEFLPAVPRTPSPDAAHVPAPSVAQRAEAQLIPLLNEPLNRGGAFPLPLQRIVASYWPTTFTVVNKIDPNAEFWFDLPTTFTIESQGHTQEVASKQAAEVVFGYGEDESEVRLTFVKLSTSQIGKIRFSLSLRNAAHKPQTIEVVESPDSEPPTLGQPNHKVVARYSIPGTLGGVIGTLSFNDDQTVPAFVNPKVYYDA